jgi:hypothetical protein
LELNARADDQTDQESAGAHDVTLHTEDGLELGAWFLPAAPEPGATNRRVAVPVAPGNGGNRANRAGLAGELRRLGLAVTPDWMVLRSPFTVVADVGAWHYPRLRVRLLLLFGPPVARAVARLADEVG